MLKVLALHCCQRLRNPEIKGENIKNIDLADTRVTDAAIKKICQSCSVLEVLDLNCCGELKNPEIEGKNIKKID